MIGGSAVGVELGQFLARMGTQVTLIQRGKRLLDREEPRLGELVADQLSTDGIDVRLHRQAVAVRRVGDDTVVELDDGVSVRTDVIVLGTGRRPRTAGLDLDTVGIPINERGAVEIDEHCRVTNDGLWALGDVTGTALFTHVAQYQARVVADTILGTPRRADYTAIPRVVFTRPEIAAVGLTSEQAHARGVNLATSELDLRDRTHRHPQPPRRPRPARPHRSVDHRPAGRAEWIHPAALAIRARIPLDTLLDGIAQFPTYSEAYLTAVESLDL